MSLKHFRVYQTTNEVEIDDHLGYEKHHQSDNPNYRVKQTAKIGTKGSELKVIF